MEVPANLRAQQTLVVYVSNTVMALIAKTVIQVNKMQGRYGLLKTFQSRGLSCVLYNTDFYFFISKIQV